MKSVDHSHTRNTLIANLLRGREMTTKLQNLIREPDRDSVDLQDVALQIFRSFADSLSLITALPDSTPISAVERSPKPPVKNRRGCYKRRRSSDAWVILSAVEEDGHAWRKYGQKDILNSTFPRCYYRCTHKPQGCKALKQVQKVQGTPILYQVTYFNRHTCSTHHHPLLPEQSTTRLISFQSDSGGGGATTPDDDQTILTIDHGAAPAPSSLKEEEAESCDAKPVPLETWQEFMESGPISWDEGASCGSSSFDGLGAMEINGEFLDIETFQFDDHI